MSPEDEIKGKSVGSNYTTVLSEPSLVTFKVVLFSPSSEDGIRVWVEVMCLKG